MLDGCLAQAMAPKTFTVDQVISNYVFVFYAAFGVTFIFTPVMRATALYYHIIDQPDRVRKMHDTPVAYLGGVAVFLGWLAGLTIGQYCKLHNVEPGWPTAHPMVRFSIVIGAVLIVVLGLWDDILGIKPWVKIGGQVFAALCLLSDGIGLTLTASILTPLSSYVTSTLHLAPYAVPEWMIVSTSCALVVAVIVGCCNATNLMDGLDGLCGGVTAIISAGFLFVAVHLAMNGGGVETNWDALRVILGLALLGAVLGFVPFNFNPASIFMGDTGSMFLGFVCGTMIVLMGQERAKWFLAATVMFALPILDTALAFTRRWINHRPLFSADKQHFHHQLVARGFSVKQTVLISYLLAVFFGLLGMIIVFMRTRYAVAFYMVIFGSIIVAAYKMGMIHERNGSEPPATLGNAETEDDNIARIGSATQVMEFPETRTVVNQTRQSADATYSELDLDGTTPIVQ
jgi:UDP-GlcNAc:undecaprenyl-phosphate GlcNAc-1-phosphate transferase